jgi:SAM-dependent methyltransferase
MVRQRLRGAVRWLDAGCGRRLLGRDLESLENELVSSARSVVGVDLDVAHLRKHLNISRRACASLHSLPFPDGTFDLITCNMVVEHLPEPLPVFREITRLLAPGVALMVHTSNTRNYLVFVNILAKKLLPRSVVVNWCAITAPPRRHLSHFLPCQPGSCTSPDRLRGRPLPRVRALSRPSPALHTLLRARRLVRASSNAPLFVPPFDRLAATIALVLRKPGP